VISWGSLINTAEDALAMPPSPAPVERHAPAGRPEAYSLRSADVDLDWALAYLDVIENGPLALFESRPALTP
jgi:hypothetical protein